MDFVILYGSTERNKLYDMLYVTVVQPLNDYRFYETFQRKPSLRIITRNFSFA